MFPSYLTLSSLRRAIGPIKQLRMVTTKGGKFKGYCYLEYEDTGSASKAVLQLNGTEVGDRKMAVAISNPPGKSGGAGGPTRAAPVDAEFGARKKAMSFLVPRAVGRPKSDAENKAAAKPDVTAPRKMLSNSAFSKLFEK